MTSGVTYASRTVLYLIRIAIIVAVIGVLLYFVFSYASAATTCFFFVKEGMTMREDVVIKDSSSAKEGLNRLFSEKFIENDALLKSTAYRGYTIRDYYSDIELVWIPVVDLMGNKVTVKVNEKVWYINGEKIPEEGEKPENPEPPPIWDSAQYEVSLMKFGDTWKIVDMKRLETLHLPTPTPSPTPVPTPTPTPAASPVNIEQ